MSSIPENSRVRYGDLFVINNTEYQAERLPDGTDDYVWLLESRNHDVIELQYTHEDKQSSDVTYKKLINNLNVQDAKMQEATLRHKYPDYPYKRIKSLTNSGKRRQNANYELVEGQVLDDDLRKEIGTDHVYYQKALKDFEIKPNQTKIAIPKGTIGGPIVANSDYQRKVLKDNANWRKTDKDQNFWLDDKSYLLGKWTVPDNTTLINSKINIKGNSVREGFNSTNSELINTNLNGHGHAMVINSVLDTVQGKPKQLVVMDSAIKNTTVDKTVSTFNSIIEDTDLKNVKAKNREIRKHNLDWRKSQIKETEKEI